MFGMPESSNRDIGDGERSVLTVGVAGGSKKARLKYVPWQERVKKRDLNMYLVCLSDSADPIERDFNRECTRSAGVGRWYTTE